jgi:hypothetical protein
MKCSLIETKIDISEFKATKYSEKLAINVVYYSDSTLIQIARECDDYCIASIKIQ